MKQARLLGFMEVGGWKAAHMQLPKGASYHTLFTGNRTRDDMGYASVWIKGRIEGKNLTTGEQLQTREPWLVSTDLPPLTVGRGEFVAVEESEWLCFDSKLNEGRRPSLAVLKDDNPVVSESTVLHQLAPGVFLAMKHKEA